MKFNRKIYFNKIDFIRAKDILKRKLKELSPPKKLKSEIIEVEKSTGRISAEPVYSLKSVPPYTTSAMDGIAVRYEDTAFATPNKSVKLKIENDFVFVNTGYPIPEKFNAVIMIENIRKISKQEVEIFAPVPFYGNMRNIGEDISEGEMIIPSYTKILPETTALMFAAGIRKIKVLKKPKALIIPTGDEIAERNTPLTNNQIHETNTIFIKYYLEEWGFEVYVSPIIKDIVNDIENELEKNIEKYDAIFFSAGTSSGSKDFIPSLIEKKGEIYFHGINYIPGKPFCFGEIKRKPVFCLPGYPGAAAGVLNEFIKEISYFFTLYNTSIEKIKANAAFKIFSKLGMREFIKIKTGKISNNYFFYPLKRGSSVLTPFIEKNGILEIEENIEGINKGEEKEITLFFKKGFIDNQIIFVGSNDFLISEIRDLIKKRDWTKDISIINVGSYGGLMAIKNRITHFSGIHLLDEETGEYNTSFIEKYLEKDSYTRLPFLLRQQGFLVRKGEKRINKIEDLKEKDISFINRQRGSGTRILLDYLLKKKSIKPENIKGYDREVFTHLETGIIVKRGEADCGIGVKAVAKILNLDFIPIAEEKYELLFLNDFLKTDNHTLLLYILESKELKQRAEKFGGYKILL
jgi:putative molybdopterin biosynthesis protein